MHVQTSQNALSNYSNAVSHQTSVSVLRGEHTLGNSLLINLTDCVEPTTNCCTSIKTTGHWVWARNSLKHTLCLSSVLVHHTGSAWSTVNKCAGVDCGLLQTGLLALLQERESIVVAPTSSIVELLTLTRGGVEEVGRNGCPTWASFGLQCTHLCGEDIDYDIAMRIMAICSVYSCLCPCKTYHLAVDSRYEGDRVW